MLGWAYKRCKPVEKATPEDFVKLSKIALRARFFDSRYRVNFCCFKFNWGYESILGLIPVIGDSMGLVISLTILGSIGGSYPRLTWLAWFIMLLNIIVDFVVGLVPFAGDILDIYCKCNVRNLMFIAKCVYYDEGKPRDTNRQICGKVMDVAKAIKSKKRLEFDDLLLNSLYRIMMEKVEGDTSVIYEMAKKIFDEHMNSLEGLDKGGIQEAKVGWIKLMEKEHKISVCCFCCQAVKKAKEIRRKRSEKKEYNAS